MSKPNFLLISQVLHLMRHGVTEMNEYLAQHRYDGDDFKDPMMCVIELVEHDRHGFGYRIEGVNSTGASSEDVSGS